MVLQAGFAALLSRLGAGTDIPVGTPVAGRTDEALDGLVGMFINTLVLRTDLSGDPSFRELVGRVREAALGAYMHQDVPFEQLVEVLRPARSLARNPLFQVMLVLQNTASATGGVSLDLPGLAVAGMPAGDGAAKVDLALNLAEQHDGTGAPAGMRGILEYSLDLFDQAAAGQVATRLGWLLEAMIEGPDQPICVVDVLAPEERRRVLTEWNDTARPVRTGTLPELFQGHAAADPQAVAVVFEDTQVTYGQLNARANRLARLLIGRGVGPESIVALALPRSVDLFAAVLAVAKAGGAYLPVDPGYPAQRITYMLTDAAPVCVITTSEVAEVLPTVASTPVLVLDDPAVGHRLSEFGDADPTDADRTAVLRPAHPAYVIYTSGSTGLPKGVVVPHAGIANLAGAQIEQLAVGAESRVLQFHSPSFDVAFLELAIALLSGARLVTAPAARLSDAQALSQLCHRQQLTHLLLPPPLLAVLAEVGGLPASATLATGGDAVSGALVEQWSPGRRMLNSYGLTETTVVATTSDLSGNETPPIGRPIANTRAYVLDDQLQPVAPGVPGELYLAGVQLARGYLRRRGPDRGTVRGLSLRPCQASGCTAPATSSAGTTTDS